MQVMMGGVPLIVTREAMARARVEGWQDHRGLPATLGGLVYHRVVLEEEMVVIEVHMVVAVRCWWRRCS